MGERGRPRSFDRDTALKRAMEVFWAQGYEGTSMSDLTAAMGIASPSIYAAFGSKEALFREAVELYSKLEGGGATRALEDAKTAREGVAALLRANAVAITDPAKPPGCMLVLAAAVGTTKNDPVREFLAERRLNMRAVIQDRLARGVTDGDLPPGTDTSRLAAFYTTVMQGLSIAARDGASRADLEDIVDSAMAAWEPLTH